MPRILLALAAALIFAVGCVLLGLLVYVGLELYLAGHGVLPPWFESVASRVLFGVAAFSGVVTFALCLRLTAPVRAAQGGGDRV